MNYRLIRKNFSGHRRFRTALVVAAVVSLAVSHSMFPEPLRSLVTGITRPVFVVEKAIFRFFNNISGFFSSKRTLIAEHSRLEEQVREQELRLLDREALAEENRLLKEQFGRTGAPEKGILAAVLALPPRSPYDTLLLDVGAAEGVREGAHVYTGPVLLGTVVRADAHTSLAELHSTAGNKTAMLLFHDGLSVPVKAEGQGGGAFTVTLPKETPAAPGDALYLAGLRPLLFGTVVSIGATLSGSFQTLYIQLPVTLSSLRFVEIERFAVE